MIYPTKQQILKSQPRCSEEEWKEIKRRIMVWKRTYYSYNQWKVASAQSRMLIICVLIKLIQEVTNNKARINPFNDVYSYNPREEIINLVLEKPSIISSLHELGHALYGPSELDACVFSVHLFKYCFPADYNKLIWEGHMLKLPTQNG